MRQFLPLLPLSLSLACTPAADSGDAKDTGSGGGDSGTDSGTDSGDSGVADQAPTAPVVSISPSAPSDSSTLRAMIDTDATDPDGDHLTYRYEWTQNGTLRTDLTSDYVVGDLTTEGDVWGLNVYATDGTLEGPAGSATATVANLGPTAPVLHIDPAAPVGGDTLTLVFDTSATDPNGDALGQTIVWYENGAHNLSWDGLTTIDGVYVDGGESFRAVVTVTDGVADPVTAEASVTVANTAPEITSVAIDPSDPKDDDDLSCQVKAKDPDGGTLTYTYAWTRDGVAAADVGDNDTVTSDLTTIGEVWTCEVTVSDGFDAVTDISADTTIRGAYGYRTIATVDLDITTDTGGDYSGTGTAEWDVYSEGSRYASNDCDIVWSFLATEDTHCRGCTYSFSADYTYDAGASSVVTGCSGMPVDSSGTMTFDSRSSLFTAEVSDASYSRYGSYYYYYYTSTPSMSARGTGGRTSTYGSYTFSNYYAVTETTDTAGNVKLTAWTDEYEYY